MFCLAFSLAFFAAFRLGELVCRRVRGAGGLYEEDVDLYQDSVVVRIRVSKTDREGRGCSISLFAVPGCEVCPVRCLQEYRRGTNWAGGPLLRHEDGTFLPRFQFVAVFKKCLRSLGMDPRDFTGHSFRIGAATEAARLGMSDEVIKRIGRWNRPVSSYMLG